MFDDWFTGVFLPRYYSYTCKQDRSEMVELTSLAEKICLFKEFAKYQYTLECRHRWYSWECDFDPKNFTTTVPYETFQLAQCVNAYISKKHVDRVISAHKELLVDKTNPDGWYRLVPLRDQLIDLDITTEHLAILFENEPILKNIALAIYRHDQLNSLSDEVPSNYDIDKLVMDVVGYLYFVFPDEEALKTVTDCIHA